MSAEATVSSAILAREDAERGHPTRLRLAWLTAIAVVLVIAGYGFNYYTLSSLNRPYSPKHDLLKPSGTIGIKLAYSACSSSSSFIFTRSERNGDGSHDRAIPVTGSIFTLFWARLLR